MAGKVMAGSINSQVWGQYYLEPNQQLQDPYQ